MKTQQNIPNYPGLAGQFKLPMLKTLVQKSLLVLLIAGLLPVVSWAQQREVSGYVFDSKTKEDIIGATVIIKEQPAKGTATNIEGRFKLKVGPEATALIINFVGYKKKEVAIPANGGDLKIALVEDIKTTGVVEVIATGLGNTEVKKTQIGSTETVKFSEVPVGSISSFDAGLQGRVAGLQVTQASGMPGGGVTVRVRGVGSMSAASEPLYIVDGIPITTGAGGDGGGGIGGNVGYQVNALADFNTNDIENITVLKDAAATAQYGSRGSNGVVIITTKRGKSGKTQFNAGMTFGFSNPTNKVATLNGEEYRRVVGQAYRNSFNFSDYNIRNSVAISDERNWITFPALNSLMPEVYRYTNTDWMSELIRPNAPLMDFNLSGSGGSEKTTFYAGLSYRDENGVMKGNRFQRLGGRFTVDNTVNERLKVGVSTAITFTQNNLVPSGQPGSGGAQGGFGTAQLRSLPIMPIFYPDSVNTRDPNNPDVITGRIANQAQNQFPFNPYYNAYGQFAGTNIALTSDRNFAYNNRTVFRNISNIYAEYTIWNTLKFRTENGIDYYNQTDQSYQSRFLRVSSLGGNLLPTASIGDSRNYFVNFNTNNFFTSDNYLFNENHNFKSSVGYSFQQSESFSNSVSGEGLPNDDSRSVSSAQRLLDYSGNETRFAFMSFYGRVNYTYKEKWVAQASYRYDGSSRFGSANKYGGFFGLGGAYIMSDEAWFEPYKKVVSILKFKASYGQTGNAAGLSNFQSFGLFTSGAAYGLQPGTSPQRFANPNLSWERSEKLDIGIDFSLFEDKIEGGITYYNSVSRDMLLGLPIPASKGLNDGNFIQNIGRVRNAGVEFNITTRNITKTRKNEEDVLPKTVFSWTTDFNISSNQNVILDLGGLKPNEITGSLDFASYIGGQVSTFYLPVFAGVAQSDDANGRWKQGDELIYRAERDANGNLTGRLTNELIRPGINRTGLIDSNRVPIFDKPVQPLFYGGITNNFKIYDFDVSVMFTFTYGNWILDDGERQQSYFNGANNMRRSVLDAWTPSNTGSNIPKMYYTNAPGVYSVANTDLRSYNVNDPMAFRNSTRFLHDGSYIRLKTLTIGYTLPQSLASKANLRNARIFFSGQNLFTWTRFPGWDPEVVGNLQSNAERNLQQGRTSFDFPQVTTYTFGLNVGF